MRKTALITGASGGIGYEFVKIFADKNFDLILVARNINKLEDIKSDIQRKYHVDVETLPMDLSNPSSAQKIYATIQKLERTINILINNAGFGDYGNFAELDWEKGNRMLQVNITTLTQLTHLFMKDMIGEKEGKILNVASTAAFQPGPQMAMYYATKAYVLSFSEAVAKELQGTGVTMTTLCPGPTKTNFQATAAADSSKLFKRLHVATAKEVAETGYKALLKGKPIAIHGILNKILVFTTRLAPRNAVVSIINKIQER